MQQPNLSHLLILAAVARHSSFRKAAEEVGISTSVVSHAIRGLEERLGVSLFNRTTRSVALTGAGERLLERMRPALEDLGSANGGLAETQELLDFCAKHDIVSDVEVVPIQSVNEALERLAKNDVRYRFVIDMATLSRG
jgi:DNA-binding transcriptional LysR family regulator